MPRVRAKIQGRVQGVSYRASAAHEARRLGLVGWVRNEPDGSVLLEAQGEDAPLAELLAWCREGPPGARVTAVDSQPVAEAADRSFAIRF